MTNEPATNDLHLVGLTAILNRWRLILGLGVILIILGLVALIYSVAATLATMVIIGWLMIAGGVLEAMLAFSCKRWSGFFINLLTGILYIVIGTMVVTHPAATAVTLTLLIAVALIIGGIFRIVVALAVRYQNRVWLILHGVINLILGFIIWTDWPISGLWVIGLFIGIDFLFNGWSLVMLSLAFRSLTKQAKTPA